MALQINLTKFGASWPNAYVRIHRHWGSKEEGFNYTVRSYLSRDAYKKDINSHFDEKQIVMPFPPNAPSMVYPDDCYAHLKAQADFAGAIDVVEAGQTPLAANATI